MKGFFKKGCLLAITALFIINIGAFQAYAAKNVQLRFSWWGNDVRHKATLAVMEAYTKKNPHVKIIGEYGGFGTYYQKLLTQLAGGTAADIIQIDYKWVKDLAAQGRLFADINSLSRTIDLKGFDAKFVKEHCAVGNYTLGLPAGISALGMIANVPLLRQAGIPVDQEWNWDNIVEAGVTLQKHDKNKHLLYMKSIHYYYMLKIMLKQKTGQDFINDDYALTFSQKDLTEALTYIRKLVDLGVAPPLEETILFDGGDPDQNPHWLNGEYGFNTNAASKLAAIIDASKFEIGVARYPIAKNAKNPGLSVTPSQIFSINAKSRNATEAAKFLNWMLNDPEAIGILGDNRGLPAVDQARKLLVAQKRLDGRMIEFVEKAMPHSGGPESAGSLNQEIQTIVEDYIQQVGFKKLSPEKAAEGMIKDLGAKVRELKGSR